MSYLYVKNLNGTSYYKPKNDTSWIKGWERIKGEKAFFCNSCFSSNKEIVGAHVQKENEDDKQWYIIPFCKKCNAKSSEDKFWVSKDELVLVKKINE